MVDRWSSMKYRYNFFSVAHFCLPWPPSSVLYKTRHKKENNTQHQRQRWTNSQECLKEELMVQNCSVNIRFFYRPPRWPPASQRFQWFRTETARHEYSWPQVLSLRDPSALTFEPGCAFPRCKKDHWPMVPKVVRNGPGHPSTKVSWSHGWWKMVPKNIQVSTQIHRFIDRSICHGWYRHRPSIHLRKNTVNIDLDRQSTYGKIRLIIDSR